MRFTGLVKGHVSSSEIEEKLPLFSNVKVTKYSRNFGEIETHFAVKNRTFPSVLDEAIHAWFQEPGEAPFPNGTLLHFSYRTTSLWGNSRAGFRRRTDRTNEVLLEEKATLEEEQRRARFEAHLNSDIGDLLEGVEPGAVGC